MALDLPGRGSVSGEPSVGGPFTLSLGRVHMEKITTVTTERPTWPWSDLGTAAASKKLDHH